MAMVDDYNKRYQRCRAEAVRILIERNREEFRELLHEQKHALNLPHRHQDLGHSHGEYA